MSRFIHVTRIDEGRMIFDMRRQPLLQIVQDALQTYYPVFSKNNNTLEVRSGGCAPEVRCDRQRITQVLVNLLTNATRHTRDGQITVGIRETGGFAEVAVADTGKGIEPERLPALFERFRTRAEAAAAFAMRDTGTGLGLYICRHIVEEHGGRIAVSSTLGAGTKIWFTIPLQSADVGGEYERGDDEHSEDWDGDDE